MIKKVEVLYFKGLRYINIDLNPYNVLVGPNASGKSTFLDVFTLLRDVLELSPAQAVEKRSSQFSELVWNQEKSGFEIVLEFQIPAGKNAKYQVARYEMALSQNEKEGIVIEIENLWLIKNSKNTNKGQASKVPERLQTSLFPSNPQTPERIVTVGKKPQGWRKIISKSEQGNDFFRSEETDWNIVYRFGPTKASLARIPEDESRFPISLWVKSVLTSGIQFLQLNSSDMRWSCRPDAPAALEANGSNLAKVIKYLQQNYKESYERWVAHVRTALPDVETIGVGEKKEDRFLHVDIKYKYKNDLSVPSWLLSDGTLRLLAQTLIAYLPEKDKIYIIEEPENGLHPLAIESVVQSISSVYENQIFLATHSPVILRLSEPKDILCFSKTKAGNVDVIRGQDHPKLKDWQKDIDLATLHAAGVLQ